MRTAHHRHVVVAATAAATLALVGMSVAAQPASAVEPASASVDTSILAGLAEKDKRYKEVDGGYTQAQVDVQVDDTTVDAGRRRFS